MAYLVLARKWRPQTFQDLIGQEAVTRTLTNAITLGRVHHALLFTGTRGVGKTTSARIIAKALNCLEGPTPKPCGVCSNCIEITQGSNVDVLEIDGASNTSVDDIRDLRETVRYAPSKSKHKIYIIDEVHMLSNNAFNALLKTLEEPPPNVFFIFATTEVHKIPETILSRVQRFDFREISEDAVLSHLKTIASAEKMIISDSSLRVIARQAQGSMRDALSLFDQVIAFAANEALEIQESEVVQVLGLTDRALISNSVESLINYDCVAALEVLSKVISQGFDLKSYLQDMLELIREALFINLGAKGGYLPNYAQALLNINIPELERWFECYKKAIEELPRAATAKHSAELAVIKITRPMPKMNFAQLLDRLEQLEKRLQGGAPAQNSNSGSGGSGGGSIGGGGHKAEVSSGVSSSSSFSSSTSLHENIAPLNPSTPIPQVTANESVGTIDSLQNLLDLVKSKKPAMAAVLEQCRSLVVKEQAMTLLFDAGSFYLSRAKDQDFLQTLQGILREVYAKNIMVSVDALKSSSAVTKAVASADIAKDREKEALGNPIVKKAMSLFQAKIEDIKPIE